MGYDYVIACSHCICWYHDGANDHGSEWSHWDASHGLDPNHIAAEREHVRNTLVRGLASLAFLTTQSLIRTGACENHSKPWPSISESSHPAFVKKS